MKISRIKLHILALSSLLGFAAISEATIVTVPSGLNPGDKYRLVFVTSTTTDATDTTAAYYNNFVNSVAQSVSELAALGVTWRVLGNLNGLDPQVNTGTVPPPSGDTVATYRLDGTTFATSYADLWDAPSVPVLYNELGATTAYAVWTGMGEAMSIPNWSSGGYIGNGGAGGNTGRASSDSAWYTYGFFGMANTTQNHLYAISDVITVVPEPSGVLLGGLGVFALLRRRRLGSSKGLDGFFP